MTATYSTFKDYFSTMQGSSTLIDGSNLASSANIIVVSIQYRLGALGFLVYGPPDGDPTIRGNFGIKVLKTAA